MSDATFYTVTTVLLLIMLGLIIAVPFVIKRDGVPRWCFFGMHELYIPTYTDELPPTAYNAADIVPKQSFMQNDDVSQYRASGISSVSFV
eukprot:m.25539 g.25539  ORF g.25539 m.25539 type:complete len:90 (+) comp7713_c0_seq2:299-568(+)